MYNLPALVFQCKHKQSGCFQSEIWNISTGLKSVSLITSVKLYRPSCRHLKSQYEHTLVGIIMLGLYVLSILFANFIPFWRYKWSPFTFLLYIYIHFPFHDDVMDKYFFDRNLLVFTLSYLSVCTFFSIFTC